MWSHIKGVINPRELTQKRKHDNEKHEETKKKKRQFNEKWRLCKEWLVEDTDWEIMYCADCRRYGGEKVKGASFVAGTNIFKAETIKDHEMSIGISTKRVKTASLQESVAVKTLVLMKSTELEKMKILFQNIHATEKKGRPFTYYLWMCEGSRKVLSASCMGTESTFWSYIACPIGWN